MLNNLRTQNLKYFLKNRVKTIKKSINNFDFNTKKYRKRFQEFGL